MVYAYEVPGLGKHSNKLSSPGKLKSPRVFFVKIMKVDNKLSNEVEYGFFDDEYEIFLTKDDYETLIRNKLKRAKFYQYRYQLINKLIQD